MMQWQLTPYTIALLISTVVTAVVALAVWYRRTARGGMALFWFMLAVVEWQLTAACEAAAIGIPAKILWSKICYIGTLSAPVLLFIFVLKHSHQEKWLTRRNLALLWVIPVTSFGLAVTNEWHHLIWISFVPSADPAKNILIYGHGTWFWVMVTYAYLLLSTATLVLIRATLRYWHLYRRQAALLLLAMPFPWVGNVLYVFNWGPFPGQDLTLIGFALTGTLLTLNLYQFRLLDIVPVARDAVLESMSDGVIVLDAQNRIVDLNPAAGQIIGHPASEILGQPAASVLSGHLDLVERYHDAAETHVEITLGADEARRHYDLRISPLHDRHGRLTGRLIVLRDVTGRKRAEEELRTRERFLECLSEVSQQLLRAGDLAEALPAILRRLGETAEVSRTYIFENHPGPEGELLCSQRCEWCAPGVEPQIDKPEQHNSPYVAGGFTRWMEILGRGDVIAGAVADLPGSERVVLESQGIRSVLVIPLFVSDAWHGFIGFDVCDRVREWQQVEIDLLRAATSDIANAIEREQASRQAQALAEAAAALTATLDFEQVLDRILEQVGRVVSNDAANVMLIDGDQARIVRWRGYERFGTEEFVSTVVFHIAEVPNLQQMVETKEPMVISDTATYPGWVHVPVQEWLRSYAAVPIVVRGEVIGFLNVDSTTPGFFTQVHLEPLRAFADYAAAAIENARLFEASHQRVAELEAVRQASLSLTSSLELPLVLEAILEHVLQLVSADDAHIFLYDAGRLTFGAALWAGGRQQEPYAEPRPHGLTYAVARSGERIVVPDMNDHPLFQDRQWDGAIVGLPLRVGDQVRGVMNVAYDKPHVFSENELGVLELLADQAAIAIENARLFDALAGEKKRLELLYGLARTLAESLSLEEVADRALRQTCSAIGAFKGILLLLESGTDRLHFIAASGYEAESVEMLDRQVGLRVGQGLAGWVIAERRTAIIADVSQDEHWLTVDGLDDWVRSALVVPLMVRDRLVGVLSLYSERLDAFDESQRQLVEAVAAPVAIAIQNARLFQSEQQQTHRLAMLADVARIVATTLDAGDLLQAVTEAIHRHFAYPLVETLTLDDEGRTLLLRGYSGISIGSPVMIAPGVYRQPIEQGIIGHVARTGKPYFASDVRTDPYFLCVGETSIRSELCVPILDEGRVVGAVDVESDRLADFDEGDQSLLEAVADTVAVGLRNVRLYEETQRRVQELTLLNSISAGFGAALNVDILINCALEGLQELVGADRTYFVTTDSDACIWETTHELVAPGIEPDIGLSGAFDDVPVELETLLSGQPFAVSDIATDPQVEGMRETYRALGMQSMLLMPVQVRGRLYGALGFDFCRERHARQPDEIRLLEGVAHQLELALENVRLLEEARLRADELAAALARQEELDRLKDEFIQNVSHELRAPLTLICGYAEMLDTGELGELQPEQQQSVAIIARRARILGDLVQDIMLILEAEASSPQPGPMPLDELALAAVEDFQMVTRQAGLTLQAEIAPHLPPVSGSHMYLRRVLDNLIGNAIKFTPEGGTITVRLRQEGQWVALEVSDTGIGMPADELEHIFERFYQVDGSIKRKYSGVGLGLALVREIVETCGGSVTVESQVGEGTTFTVLLPIAAGADE